MKYLFRFLGSFQSAGRIAAVFTALVFASAPVKVAAYTVCGPDVSGCTVTGECLIYWCASDSATGSGQCSNLARGTHKCVMRSRAKLDNCNNQPVQPCCGISYMDFDTHKDCSTC